MQDNADQGPIKKASIHSMTARYGGAVFAPICTIIISSIQQLGATEVEISLRYGVWRDGESVADVGRGGCGGHCAGQVWWSLRGGGGPEAISRWGGYAALPGTTSQRWCAGT